MPCRYGAYVTANLASRFVPTYQYLMSVENSFGLLNVVPLPSKSSQYVVPNVGIHHFIAHGFDLGVSHADDLELLSKLREDDAYARFVDPHYDKQVDLKLCSRWTDEDELASRRACILWTNFAKTGNPTPPNGDTDEVGSFQWLPVSEATAGSRYLNFDSTLYMDESDQYVEDMQFFDDATQDFS